MLVAVCSRHARLWSGAHVQRDFSFPGTGRGNMKAGRVYFILKEIMIVHKSGIVCNQQEERLLHLLWVALVALFAKARTHAHAPKP